MRKFLPVLTRTTCHGCGAAVEPSPTQGYSRQALVVSDDPGATEARTYCSNRCINADAASLSAVWDVQADAFLTTATLVEDKATDGLRERVWVAIPFRPTARYTSEPNTFTPGQAVEIMTSPGSWERGTYVAPSNVADGFHMVAHGPNGVAYTVNSDKIRPVTDSVEDMAQAMREVAKDREDVASAIGRFLYITTDDSATRDRQMRAARQAFGDDGFLGGSSPMLDAFRQGWHLGRMDRQQAGYARRINA